MSNYSDFKVGDFVEVDNYPYGGVVRGTVTKTEGVYIWLDNDPAPYHTAGAYLLNNVITQGGVTSALPANPVPTDDLARLQAENKRLRDALAWYAEDMNYLVEKVVYDKHGQPWYAYVAEGDVQERARKALGGE